ncbi:MAG: hypothetical protein ABI333_25980 [bacterium]
MTGLRRAVALGCPGAILGLAACGDEVGATRDAASGDAVVVDGGGEDAGVQVDAATANDAVFPTPELRGSVTGSIRTT